MSNATTYAPPKTPLPAGSQATHFGGPSVSALDVLLRARAAISPRGAWNPSGWKKDTTKGHARCVRQICRDVDGKHVKQAEAIILRVIKKRHPEFSSIETFNDSKDTHKHHVIAVLDEAIEIARKEGK